MGEPQSRSGRSGEEENNLPLLGTQIHFINIPALILTTLQSETRCLPLQAMYEVQFNLLKPSGNFTYDQV
jgi:hypothetical protein